MSEADEETETIEGAMAVYMAIATQVIYVMMPWAFTLSLMCMICICMNLWGVVVLELDSHPYHNK